MKRRKLLFAERLMSVNGEGSLKLSVAVTFLGEIKLEDLEIALRKLQQKHPQLRTYIDHNQEYFIYPDNYKPISITVLERENDDYWKTVSKQELAKPINLYQESLMRVVWIRSEHISDIQIIFPHIIGDGKTLNVLMKDLCYFLDNPDQEDFKIYEPFNSLEDLVPGIKLGVKDKLLAFWLKFVGKILINIQISRKKPFPDERYVTYFNFKEETCEALKVACKKHNTTTGTLFMIVMSKVMMNYYQPEKSKRLFFLTLDIRRYIPTLKKDMMFAFAPMLKLNVDFSSELNIWKHAKNMNDEIVTIATNNLVVKRLGVGYPIQKGLYFLEQFNKKSIINLLTKRNFLVDEGQDFNFANIGLINLKMKNEKIEIKQVHCADIHLPWKNSNFFGFMEYKNCLHIQLGANIHTISKDSIDKIKKDFITLINELLKKEGLHPNYQNKVD